MSYDNYFWGDKDTPNHSQWRIQAEKILADRDIWHATATKYFPLGAIAEMRDGRRWRYCEKDGTNALTKTYIIAACDGTANWYDQPQTYGTAFVIGNKIVTIFTATTIPAHALIDGYMVVTSGTGYREMYIIKDNKVGVATTGGYTIECEIADQGGVRVATLATTGTTITVMKNKYKDVILAAYASPLNAVIGVPLCTVPVNYFFWAQTRGPCPVAVDDTSKDTAVLVAGDYVMLSTDAQGSGCIAIVAADGADDNIIGQCIEIAPVDETALIDLTIE